MKRFVGLRALVAAPLLALVCFATSASGAGAAAPTGTKVVAPKPRIPRGATQLGPVSPAANVSGAVVLEPRDGGALTRFISQVTDKHSPLFHHYLTPATFAARFGPTSLTIATVESQLRASGLNVTGVARDGLIIDFEAPASQVESAFRTGLQRYRLANGSIGRARTAPVQVPATIAEYVRSVVGLDTTVKLRPSGILRTPRSARGNHPAAKTASFPHPAGSPTACTDATSVAEAFGGLTDDQIANAYGAFGLYGAGDTGSGQHIAIFELEPFDKTDVQTFDTCYFGASTAASMLARLHVVNVDGGPGEGPGFGESILDIQDVSAFAPGANIDVYQAPNTTFGALDEYAKIVNDDVDQVVTTSWGLCEQAVQQGSPGVQQAENIIFQEAAAQGQTVFSAVRRPGQQRLQRLRDAATRRPCPLGRRSFEPAVRRGRRRHHDRQRDPTTVRARLERRCVRRRGRRRDLGVVAHGCVAGRPAAAGRRGLAGEPERGHRRRELRRDELLPRRQQRRTGRDSVSPGPRRQRQCRRVHGRHHHLHRGASAVWNTIGGTSSAAPMWAGMLADVNASQTCQNNPATQTGVGFASPLLYSVASNPTAYAASFNDITDREQRPVRRLEPVPGDDGLRHGLGPRYPAADAAERRRRARVLPLQPGAGDDPADRHEPLAGRRPHVRVEHERDDHRLALPGRLEPGGGRSGRQLPGAVVRLQRDEARPRSPPTSRLQPTSSRRTTRRTAPDREQVTVTLNDGETSAVNMNSWFTYVDDNGSSQALPTVTSVHSYAGPDAGGNTVDIYGCGLHRGDRRHLRRRQRRCRQLHRRPATGRSRRRSRPSRTGRPPALRTARASARARTPRTTSARLRSRSRPRTEPAPTSTIQPLYEGAISFNEHGVIATPAGQEPSPASTEYDYVPAPTITSISTNGGPASLASEDGGIRGHDQRQGLQPGHARLGQLRRPVAVVLAVLLQPRQRDRHGDRDPGAGLPDLAGRQPERRPADRRGHHPVDRGPVELVRRDATPEFPRSRP